METPKHTPGPWVTDSDTGREYVLAPPLDENEGGATIICSMGLESEANTRLIAAAPDLLEALDAALAQIDTVSARLEIEAQERLAQGKGNIFLCSALQPALRETSTAAHDAIAKATK